MKICILFTYVFYLLDNVSEICVDLQDKPSSKFCFKYIKCFQVDWWHPNPPLARKLIYRLNASKYVEMLHNYEKLQIILSTCMIDVIIVKSLLFFFFFYRWWPLCFIWYFVCNIYEDMLCLLTYWHFTY